MVDSTEGEPIGPAAAEVGDINILVALCSVLTPTQQRVSLGASVATQQQVETILGLDGRQLSEGRIVLV